MKSTNSYKTYLQFFVLFILFSCKKEKLIDQNTDNFSTARVTIESSLIDTSINGKRSYLIKNFKLIVKQLGKAAKNTQARNQIENLIKTKFDGDYDALVQNIASLNKVAQTVSISKLQQACDAFQNIEGHNFFPQIYIPSFNITDTLYNNQPVEFVLYDGNEDKNSYPGYMLNEDDSLILSGNDINEEYAMSHPLWVVSINENVTDNGILDLSLENNKIPKTEEILNYRIKTINVKCAKESWLGGKSEVSMRSILHTWNGRIDGQPNASYADYNSTRTTTSDQGYQIIQTGSLGGNFTVNFSLQSNWNISNYYISPIVYTYVVFEADNWPTALRTESCNPLFAQFPTTEQRFLKFRSADGSYYIGSFYGDKSGWPSNVSVSGANYDNTTKKLLNQTISNPCIYYYIEKF